jgi:hypothetical protein
LSPKRARCPGADAALVLSLTLGLTGPALAASYSFRPEIEVEQTFDDNVLSGENQTGRPSQEISSWGTRMAPSVSLMRKSDTSEVTLQGGLSRRNTYSLSDIDGTDEQLAINARRLLTQRLSIGARASRYFYASYNPIEELDADGDAQLLFADRPELTLHTVGGDVTYALSDTTELTGELEWNDWEWGNPELNQLDLFDNSDRSVSLTLSRQFTAADKLGSVASYSISEEEPTLSRDFAEPHTHDELGMLMGFWQRSWAPRWSTILQAGVRSLDSELDVKRAVNGGLFSPPCVGTPIPGSLNLCFQDEETTNSGSGFVGGGSVSHAYSDRGQVSLSYFRDTRTGTASSTGSSAIDQDRFALTLAHKLSAKLTLTLGGSYLSYENTDEGILFNSLGLPVPIDAKSTTRMRNGALRLDWQLRKNMTAYARFEYFDFDQERPQSVFNPENDYARRIWGVGVRYFFDVTDEY